MKKERVLKVFKNLTFTIAILLGVAALSSFGIIKDLRHSFASQMAAGVVFSVFSVGYILGYIHINKKLQKLQANG